MLRSRISISLLLTFLIITANLSGLISPSVGQAAPSNRISFAGGNWFLFGYNFGWHNYNDDFDAGWSGGAVLANYSLINAQFAQMRSYGTRVTRWYIFNDASHYPLFNAQGLVQGLPPNFLANFDAALQIASANGIYLIPVLVDDENLNLASNTAARPTVITDTAVRQSYLDNAVKPLLQRYATHPNILAWSILNEPEFSTAGADPSPDHILIPYATMRSFISQTAQYIHTYATQMATLETSIPQVSKWTGLGLDLYLTHYYPWMDLYWPTMSPYQRTAASYGVDKPIVITEFATSSASQYTLQQSLDTFYANGYAGALPWCTQNNQDQWCDFSTTTATMQSWAQAHLADIDIRPLTGSPTPVPSATVIRTPTAPPTATTVPAATRTPTAPPAATSTPQPTATAQPTVAATPTAAATAAVTATPTPRLLIEPTVPPVPTAAPTTAPTSVPTSAATATATVPAPTYTPTGVPTSTATRTPTLQPSPTRTPTTAATATRTPTVPPTATPPAGAPRVLFNWDTPGNAQNWAADWGSASNLAQTSAQSKQGGGSLGLQTTLQGAGWRDFGIARYYNANQDLRSGSNTLSGWVYLPAGAPSGLIAQLGLFNPSYTLAMSVETYLVPGQWTQLVWPNAPLAQVRGVTVAAGGNNPNYVGPLYVDYITVQ